MDGNVYIMGHKNPDADSICSAIGYAAFKQGIGAKNHIAARCGNSNARIDTILNRFKHALPPFVGDVTPRIRDIMISEIVHVSKECTCAEALDLIDDHDIRVLPVVNKEQQLEGSVSIFQLGEYFIPKPRDLRELRRVYTSIEDIVRSLKASVIHLHQQEKLEDLFVRVGAMDIRSFNRISLEEKTKPEQSIIVVGDRYDIQQKSIQIGVRLLVITGDLEIDDSVIQMAKERNVCLIVSHYDSATTSWIIRSANRLDRIIKKDIVSFSPDEKLTRVKRRLADKSEPMYAVLAKDGKLLGIFSKTDLLKPIKTKLILVDHNEISQAVPGAAEVEILEIIDHHRLGNPPTRQPILFLNEPVGSTCTIVADQFKRTNLKPSPQIAGILMSGMIADTLNLQSPTSTEKDSYLLDWLSKIANVDANELAQTIFSSGSVILSSEPEAIVRNDMKIYTENDHSFSVSQVEESGYENFFKNEAAINKALDSVREKESYFFSALLVTDIDHQNSLLIIKGDQDFISHISYAPTKQEGTFDLPGIVSRKKQLVPHLTSLLNGLEK